MVVIGILGLLVGILAVAVIPKLTEAKNKLEVKQVGDLMAGFQNIAADDAKKRKLKDLKDVKGEKFYEAAFKKKLLEDGLLSKIVSLNSTTDSKADKAWIEQDGGEMPSNSVSYTAPKANDLLTVMSLKGKNRKIILTFNSRNWANYKDQGTIVQWSDGDTATYMTKDDATGEFSLDANAWDNSPGDIIGERPPFDRTFE
ncbi:MAG: hypothetical protein ICCCNLDF_03518 [Planctomycetes bacterium]|nr:hypothetical protein [Planctomycetota bacterium]